MSHLCHCLKSGATEASEIPLTGQKCMVWAQDKEDEGKLCGEEREREKKNVYSVYCLGRTMWAGQVAMNPLCACGRGNT